MVIYEMECELCGTVKEFASRKEMDKYSCQCHEKKPLLTIELQDETAVPKVLYKGEEIKLKQHVSFDWDTDTSIPGGLSYAIEHHVKGEGHSVVNRFERRVKGHAAD